MRQGVKMNKKPWGYDFDGECMPEKGVFSKFEYFSVKIFQWRPNASGKGLKKSPAIHRVRGKSDEPEKVYARAKQICEDLEEADGDISFSKRSETVK